MVFNVPAYSTDPHNVSISALTPYFSFKEYSDNGTLLDSEKGWLKGASVAYEYSFEDIHFLQASVSRYSGTVEYEGHTQSGSKHNTETKTSIYQTRFTYLFRPFDLSGYKVGFQISDNQWKRFIQSKNAILGLNEIYQWHAFSISQELSFKNVVFSLSPSILTNAKMSVDLTEVGNGIVKVPLKRGYEIDSSLKYVHSINSTLAIYVGTAFLWRYFPESDSVTSGSRTIKEPENELFQPRIELGLQFQY